MKYFEILHKLDEDQFQALLEVLGAGGDADKISAITKQLRQSQRNLSAAIAADTPKP
jgi:hypothetical protein